MSSFARRFVLPKAIGWREAAILLAVAWLVPFLVHLIPWSGQRPLGVYTLPIFWTTFVAIYFYGALPGLAIGLFTPLVNLALTGLPVSLGIGLMGTEAALFTAVAALMVVRWPGFRFAAPLAWIAAKALAITIQFLIPAFGYSDAPLAHLSRSAQNGLAGLGMLAVINALLVEFYPKTDAWEKE